MSGPLIIGLIVLLWLIVLGPLIVRAQRPVSRTNEGFEDTRVVFEGDSDQAPAPRRPRFGFGAVDLHDPLLKNPGQDEAAGAEVQPELISEEEQADADTAAAADTNQACGVADGAVVAELPKAQASADIEEEAEATPDAAADEAQSQEWDEEDNTEQEYYPYDSSFVSPADVLHPAADYSEGLESGLVEEGDDAAASGPDAAGGVALRPTELTAEEEEFARSRRGRGGFDPERERAATELRYARRRRTVGALVGVLAVGLLLGFISGGWTWLVAAAAGVLLVLYLVALRKLVVAERELRAVRIAHMRRARMGVRTERDHSLGVPERRHRPGTQPIDIDDQSPDFEQLPTVSAADYFDVEPDSGHAGKYSLQRGVRGGRAAVINLDDRRAG